MNNNPCLVECRDVHKKYGDVRVLDGVDLSVARGELLCIIGPSGSGKSTLLRCLNRLEEIDSGEIIFNDLESSGQPIDPMKLRRKVGMVFQQFNLFPHMTVLENVMAGPRYALDMDRDAAEARARSLLDRVSLSAKTGNFPYELSGGQQQRVAIARALAIDPEVMLFDEVTSALDPELVGEVLGVMRDLARDGMTMLVVTHQMLFAERFASRIVMFDRGKIIESGVPRKIFQDAENPRTRAFLSQVHMDDVLGAQ